MSEVAKDIQLRMHRDGTADLLVNGEEFPWDVAWEGVEVRANGDTVPHVKVTIFAHAVSAILVSDDKPATVVDEAPAALGSLEPWTLGWEFKLLGQDEPPSHVTAVRCLDDEGEWPILQRINDGWAWRSEDGEWVFSTPDPQEWDHLSDPASHWANRPYQVVEVTGLLDG